jgi:hypothetical protein
MPLALVSTRNAYVTWPLTKDIPLLTPEQNNAVAVGRTVPWSWSIYKRTLTWWDDKGREFDMEGDEQDIGDTSEDLEMCDGGEWGYESEESEDEESSESMKERGAMDGDGFVISNEDEDLCDKCGYTGKDVQVHSALPWVARCSECAVVDGKPICPKETEPSRETCSACLEQWEKLEEAEFMKDMMASVTSGARECGATRENAVKAIDALREMCKANPSLIEVTKKSE